MQLEIITLQDILTSEISLKDKFWFCCNKILTREENQLLAIKTAEIVLNIYEDNYPNGVSLKKAIQMAKDYLNNNISHKELIVKKNNMW